MSSEIQPQPATGRAGKSRPGRPRGPRRSRAERREELLDAAERAIRRVGPAASMDELAAEAGITKPILYSHFGDRAGLAEALAERTADMLIATVGGALREAAQVGPAELVTRSAIQAFCDFIEQEPSIYRFLVRSTFDDGNPVSSRLATEVARRITKLLGRALREAGADSGAAEPWAFGMVGLSFAGAEWWLNRRTMPKEDLVEYLTQLLWGGLAGAGLDRLELYGDDLDLDSGDEADGDPGAGAAGGAGAGAGEHVELANVTQLDVRRSG